MMSRNLLSRGAQGRDVQELQRALQGLGLYQDGAIDGIYGPKTAQAVRAFQETYGLAVDGVVGPETRAMLLTITGETLPQPIGEGPYQGPYPGAGQPQPADSAGMSNGTLLALGAVGIAATYYITQF